MLNTQKVVMVKDVLLVRVLNQLLRVHCTHFQDYISGEQNVKINTFLVIFSIISLSNLKTTVQLVSSSG